MSDFETLMIKLITIKVLFSGYMLKLMLKSFLGAWCFAILQNKYCFQIARTV